MRDECRADNPGDKRCATITFLLHVGVDFLMSYTSDGVMHELSFPPEGLRGVEQATKRR